MKRLKNALLGMEPNTSTYHEMYEGRYVIPPGTFGNPTNEAFVEYDPTYWYETFSCSISMTHKLAQDKPTLVWRIPTELLGITEESPAAADFCLRAFAPFIDELNAALYNRSRPDDETGKYDLYRPGGEVLIRNTAYFALCPQKDYENGNGDRIFLLNDGKERPLKRYLCIRMQVQLPKRKLRRTIQMLCRDLPQAVERFVMDFDTAKLGEALALAEKQKAIREYLKTSKYCAFIANGSILPRSKGTDSPLANAVPFRAAPEDEIEIFGVRGMGIMRGITVITGGGYSGKSTLLDAISAGIYDHILGDGRELCITDETAMTISAEDGRSVKHGNVSPFIAWLPSGDPRDFSTEHASGSTSQAANIMEAVEIGAKLLLIDEDRSATNFMIRDRLMKALIEKEPITPFTDRASELYTACGVSTILVIGGSGEYLAVADKIYIMEDFIIRDVTARSKALCAEYSITQSMASPADWTQKSILSSDGFTSYPDGSGSENLMVSDMGFIRIGDERVDFRGLHDLVSSSQADAIGYMIRYLMVHNTSTKIDLAERIDALYREIEKEGLDLVFSAFFTTMGRFLDLPRPYEVYAVVRRMRKIHVISSFNQW